MITFILITLWILIGFISFKLADNAWKVHWYNKFQEHFNDTHYYDFTDELIRCVAISLGGIISFLVIGFLSSFYKDSEWYFPKSLWMINYNKEKVEKYFK